MQSSVFLVGKLVHHSCRASYFVSFSLFTRFTEFAEITDIFWCVCISVSCSTIIIYLVRLLTADGSSLTCSGSQIIPLRFGTHRLPLQLAPVTIPILGAEFLRYFNLLLYISNQRVFSTDLPTSPSTVLPTSPDFVSAPLKANLLTTLKCISDLLIEFPDVVSSDGFTASKPGHGVTHNLLMQPGPPREGVQRRHDPRKNDLRTSGFAELPPGPAKLVSQPQ